TFETSTGAGYVTGTTLLTVTDEANGNSAFVTLVGDYSSTSWSVSDDGNGGADVAETPAGPTTDNWTGGAGITDPSDWYNPNNWSVEVPTSSDNAVINGDFLVTISPIASFYSGYPAVAGSLALSTTSATLQVSDGGALDVSGTLTNSGSILIAGAIPTGATYSSATFAGGVNNTGNITVGSTTGSGNFANTATFGGTVINTGTIESDAGSSVTFDNGTLTNSAGGTVDAAGGTITLDTGNTVEDTSG